MMEGPSRVSRSARRRASLELLAQRPIDVITALTYGGAPPQDSHSTPHKIIGDDGRAYWIKSAAQGGLECELIGGRLVDQLNAGPIARIVDVPQQALPSDGSLARLQGRVVGSLDITNTVNARYLGSILSSGALDPSTIDRVSRARVIVVQTWLGVRDEQVLLHLTTGRVLSIDHGDCLPPPGQPVRVVVAPIPGVSDDLGRDRALLLPIVEEIRALSESAILNACAGVPVAPGWTSTIDRSHMIAEGLFERREMLEEAISEWAPRLP